MLSYKSVYSTIHFKSIVHFYILHEKQCIDNTKNFENVTKHMLKNWNLRENKTLVIDLTTPTVPRPIYIIILV